MRGSSQNGGVGGKHAHAVSTLPARPAHHSVTSARGSIPDLPSPPRPPCADASQAKRRVHLDCLRDVARSVRLAPRDQHAARRWRGDAVLVRRQRARPKVHPRSRHAGALRPRVRRWICARVVPPRVLRPAAALPESASPGCCCAPRRPIILAAAEAAERVCVEARRDRGLGKTSRARGGARHRPPRKRAPRDQSWPCRR